MQEKFRHYHQLTSDEESTILNQAIIVLDTNVLLDFYSFGELTRNDYYKVLNLYKQKEQIWLPHQVGLEFFENRLGIITKQSNQYDNILNYLSKTKDNIANLSNSSTSHTHLDFIAIANEYETKVKPLKNKIDRMKKNHPDYILNDEVLEEIDKIYESALVGEAYDEKRIGEIIEIGESRYSANIPPGYEDKDKKESETEPSRNRKYGDLILWFQIIDMAKIKQKPVIFVTNDSKNDWVKLTKSGVRLGAKPALKKEMRDEASVDFVLYSSDEFLEKSRTNLGLTLDKDSVEEVKRFRQLQISRDAFISRQAKYSLAYEDNTPFEKSSNEYEELNFALHRGRRLARKGLFYARENGLPERLCDTFLEMEILLKRCSRMLIQKQAIKSDDLIDLSRLTDRVMHIAPESNVEIYEILTGIIFTIESIKRLLDQRQQLS